MDNITSFFKTLSLSFICIAISLSVPASAEKITENVEYKDGDTLLQGYQAYDNSIKEQKPGILIVHEWNCLGTYVKKRAKQIAKLGYPAFCIDMYGKEIRPKNDEESLRQATILPLVQPIMKKLINGPGKQ